MRGLENEEGEGIQIPATIARCYPERDRKADSQREANERGCSGEY